jgi:hypothetical protein
MKFVANGVYGLVSEKFFQQSETGVVPGPDVDPSHSLRLHFLRKSWEEHHPFGSTTSVEYFTEVVEEGQWFELDGERVELDELYNLFGTDWLNNTLQAMEHSGKLDPYQYGDDHDLYEHPATY